MSFSSSNIGRGGSSSGYNACQIGCRVVGDKLQMGLAAVAAMGTQLVRPLTEYPLPPATNHAIVDILKTGSDEYYKNRKKHLKNNHSELYGRIKGIRTILKEANPESDKKVLFKDSAVIALTDIYHNELPEEEQGKVALSHATLKKLDGTPYSWTIEKKDLEPTKLAYALDMNGHLGRPGAYCLIFDEYEERKGNHSCFYSLNRPELEKGAIGYINGIDTTLDTAKYDAERISNYMCSYRNIRGIFNASQGKFEDLRMTLHFQGGVATTPTKMLIMQWTHFFHNAKSKDEKFLQICYSQGAAHVHNALKMLPPELRTRISVICIAPAIFFKSADPDFIGTDIFQFYKAEDFVFSVALNRSIVEKDRRIQRVAADESHAHDPIGGNFIAAIKPLIDNFIIDNTLVHLHR